MSLARRGASALALIIWGACGDDGEAGKQCATCDAADSVAVDGTSAADTAVLNETAEDTIDVADVGPCDLACPAPTYCDNSEGFARCRCPLGYDGSECERCATGWRQLEEDGACVPSCDRVAVCGQGLCSDLLGPVTCTCPPGRVGGACESCAPGLVVGANDRCERPRDQVPAGALIVPLPDESQTRLAEVDPESGVLTPIAGRYASLGGYAFGWDREAIYWIHTNTLVRAAADGSAEADIADLEPFKGEHGTFIGPTLDRVGGRAFVAVTDEIGYANSDSQILAVDLDDGTVAPLGLAFQLGARALAWDETRLWIATETQVATFDPSSGESHEEYTHHVPLHLSYSPGAMALTNDALVLPTSPPDGTLWLRQRCAELASWLGTDPKELRVAGQYAAAPAATTLTTDSREPTLVVYGAEYTDSIDFPEPIEITVATTHPDDVVCVLMSRQPTTVTLAAGSSPRQVIVSGFDKQVLVTAPSGYEPKPGQLVTIGSASSTFGESTHFETAAFGAYTYAPNPRDTLLFLDREDGATRWLTLPGIVRDLPGVTTAP